MQKLKDLVTGVVARYNSLSPRVQNVLNILGLVLVGFVMGKVL